MSRWLRSTEYELDDFDWLHGRIPGPPVPFRSRDTLYAVAMIAATPALLGVIALVEWLTR